MRGDPINLHPLPEVLMSDQMKSVGLSTAFVAAVGAMQSVDSNDLISDVISNVTSNLETIFWNRYIFEKIILSQMGTDKSRLFVDSDTLEKLCIDKSPTPEVASKSLGKYGEAAIRAKWFCSGLTAIDGLFAAAFFGQAVLAGEVRLGANLVAEKASDLTFGCSGIYRFNKVAKGEWAIVDTPSPDKIAEMQESFDSRHNSNSLVPDMA